MKSALIAPCGMNCNICMAYLREKNTCPGCRAFTRSEPVSIARCVIKNCHHLKDSGRKFCSERCGEYPCKRLKALDKRYRTKYGMSMLANLESIEKEGIRRFIEDERRRWQRGDEVVCVHNRKYYPKKKK